MNKLISLSAVAFLFCTILFSCKKGPGEGGTSSITGYVHVIETNASMVVEKGQHAGQDRDVYIIYGDDVSFGDRTRTNFDGKFEFKYLREGDYRVYVYSDTVSYIEDSIGKPVVYKDVEITDKKQTIDTDTLLIKNIN